MVVVVLLFGSHAGTHQIRDQSHTLEDRNDSNNSLEVYTPNSFVHLLYNSLYMDMNHPTELREKMFRHSQKASRNFCWKLNLLFRFKLEKYLCIIVADLPLIAKI